MKRMILLLLMLTSLAPLYAQTGFDFSAGLTRIDGFMGEDTGDYLNTGFHGAVAVHRSFSQRTTLGIRAAYHEASLKEELLSGFSEADISGKASFMTVIAFMRLPLASALYLDLGGGLYRWKVSASARIYGQRHSVTLDEENDAGLCGRAGYARGRFFLDASYHLVFTQSESSSFFTAGVGIRI